MQLNGEQDTVQSNWDFRGKRALVTGAADGIGLAIASSFTQAGADVILLGRDGEALKKGVDVAASAGPGSATSVVCDLSNAADIQAAAAEALARLGGIDILVNNAGVGGSRNLVQLSDRELDLNLDINLRAPILLTRAVLPGMLERGQGVVINISSQAAKVGYAGITHYSASKAGLLGFTISLAVEVAPAVRVNAICPGAIMTKMMEENVRQLQEEKGITRDQAAANWTEHMPMGRMQQPHDIANAVLFLASDAASEITGEALNVSGGQVMH
ncbi:SDR family NAD(P)-dependent oxidoreductase [Arthrobacter sp. MI7-26]|uniref:SDR family NAD(P)-dependent oxidoreductase n=1 Tax=Arthrobacter sp. MI7-26 TaxID=2993653 RepID=UPI002248FC73|nr:SDR family oxidoreductase [Arthrobacter sp. MI7-26]MCX2746295.1 SDR family NAD(P)-dependent oxidoreductase [Arthrobacter sp. MI7-26]